MERRNIDRRNRRADSGADRHAVETTEFYKNYPADSALTDLPVINKDTFRQNYDRFLSKTYKDAPDNRVMCTSGSTGTPLPDDPEPG